MLLDATSLDNLADWSCTGGVVMGPKLDLNKVTPQQLDAQTTSISVSGEGKAAGVGTKCPLGGPLWSVLWCVNHLAKRGIGIEKGQMIISGATCKTRAIEVSKKANVIKRSLNILFCVLVLLRANAI